MDFDDVRKIIHQIRGLQIATPARARHSVVIPFDTYSPWLEDPLFIGFLNMIQPYTLVDHYRCFELWKLVPQTSALGGDIIEVGVWRGGTGCLMAASAKMAGRQTKVILCDTFTGVVKASARDTNYVGGEHADASAAQVTELAAKMSLDNIQILEGIFPEETGDQVADHRFNLCHIDVDVYESARDVLDWIWPRLLIGGIVVFDDYGNRNTDGITHLVNERYGQPGSLIVHNLNGHAVMVKTADA
jgi:O-methyltransferase